MAETDARHSQRLDSHKADNGSDLDNGKDEFGLTVCLDTEQVDEDDCDEEYGDKDGLWQRLVPVRNSIGAREDF